MSGCATLGTPVWIDGPDGVTWSSEPVSEIPLEVVAETVPQTELPQVNLLVLSPSCVCQNSTGGLSAFVALTVVYRGWGMFLSLCGSVGMAPFTWIGSHVHTCFRVCLSFLPRHCFAQFSLFKTGHF